MSGIQPLQRTRPETEFVLVAALLMALVALAIDMMLPALPAIAADLGATSANARQQVVTVLLFGLTVAQIVYGPLSDRIGRKAAIGLGTAVFVLGSLLSAVATDYCQMLLGRLLQGFGVAAMRVVLVAVVRDRYEGAAMARIMSLIMSVFIVVPCIAPLAGQGILLVAPWRAIFVVFIALASLLFAWFWLRQEETLPAGRRLPINFRTLRAGAYETLTNRVAMGHTLVSGLLSGAFIGYLASSQQLLQDAYPTGRLFPLYFALLALALGTASLLNARLVQRFGMRWLSVAAIAGIVVVSTAVLLLAASAGFVLSFGGFLAGMALILFLVGFAFGNLNAIAMQPLGHIAGIASSVLSSAAGLVAVVIGSTIGAAFDGSAIPLMGGFALASTAALAVMRIARPAACHA